jgi:ABC-type bacteriocin/lantibiotic exporter with double-glycine peptidase domain
MSPRRRGLSPPVLVALVAPALAAGCYTGSARDVSPDRVAATDPGWVLVKGVPFVAQRRDDDCGAAALAMALRYHHVPVSEADILAQASPHDGGITAGQLRDVARTRGTQAFVIAGTWDDLEYQLRWGRPVVVGLMKPHLGGRSLAHFEVVVGFNRVRREVRSLDPARGPRENSVDGFAAEWAPAGSVMLVIIPDAPVGDLPDDEVGEYDAGRGGSAHGSN